MCALTKLKRKILTEQDFFKKLRVGTVYYTVYMYTYLLLDIYTYICIVIVLLV